MKALKLLALSASLITSAAFAQPITVVNGNGENSALSEGVQDTTLLGWTKDAGKSGVFNGNTEHFTAEPQGNTIFINKNGKISQLLGYNLDTDTTYKIGFDVFDRLGKRMPGYKVTLTAGNTIVYQAVTPVLPAVDGASASFSGEFDSTGSNHVGEPLTLSIEATGRGQIHFDNITMEAIADDAQPVTGAVALGEWQHPTADGTRFVVNGVYEAESDGFITYYNDRTCSGNIDLLHVGDSANAINIKVNRISGSGGMMGVVKKGQFWKITRWRSGDCIATIGFLPFAGAATE